MAEQRPTLLLISQVYVPDPASVGQHMHDTAVEMVSRGWRVVVFAANRGYDDPTEKFKSRQTLDGVEIVRFGLSSFGKSSIAKRLMAGTIFMIQCIAHGLFVGRLNRILVSTSPPMASIAAMVIRVFRRVPIKYWVMDLNPDQMIELGKLKPDASAARLFNALNRAILKRADDVVALDRFMAERLDRKLNVREKMSILPPWPHADHLEVVEHADNPFRRQHNPDHRFVIMYSGNHGFSTPVETVLQAGLKLQDRPVLFMFIGGGVGKQRVEEVIKEHQPGNIVSLPYQPLDQIRYSLSAADVHLVSVGNEVVGVVHPCKVYGAMAIARPILLLGPDPCHVSDLVRDEKIGWHIQHDDVDGAVATIEQILATPEDELRAMGQRAYAMTRHDLSKPSLLGAFCDILERDGKPNL